MRTHLAWPIALVAGAILLTAAFLLHDTSLQPVRAGNETLVMARSGEIEDGVKRADAAIGLVYQRTNTVTNQETPPHPSPSTGRETFPPLTGGSEGGRGVGPDDRISATEYLADEEEEEGQDEEEGENEEEPSGWDRLWDAPQLG